ncbi:MULTISPECIES: ABC transporter permease [Microbacterium]|uniref:ABC transporter permease n=2 Tax=Microbacterium wangchenii TaxID=2541726 RepID=A0ABX5SR50_9MICO|nr:MULTISPECIES: ABC transporter permease [Microbacterium]MCK6065149.1 ABC transporter permease [Microbacterium sp. EYE_512]QBR88606.1 ABC transporter permease [Microbacterium wangchenii]TXK20331.1 FtsX-like permease family protein [Microbacterium wangchenii]
MLTLILAGLRQRAAAVVSIVIAAGLGSALIVLSGAMFETGIRLAAPPERVAGADLVVIGSPSYAMLDAEGRRTTDLRPFPERHRLPEEFVADAAQLDGVEQAVPIRFFDAVVRTPGRAVTTAGQNWASAPVSGLEIPRGSNPGAGEVVLTAAAAASLGVEAGDRLTVTAAGRTGAVEVTTVIGDAAHAPTLFLGDAALPDEGIDALGVVRSDGAAEADVRAALESHFPDVRVLTGEGRGAAEDPAVSAARTPTIVIGAVFGGIVLTVLATVASGIVALSVRQRGREISLLRATGATGRQARALLVGEASLAGIVGALIGLALGVPLAHGLFAAMRAWGVVPGILQLRVGVIPFAIALVTTTAVVWFAARLAARPARRARAIDAMREAELPRARVGFVRWLLGLVFGGGAVALAILTCFLPPSLVSATAGPAVLAGAISASLLAPVHLRLGRLVLRPVIGGFDRGLGGLAGVNVRSRIATFSTVTGAAALVVGIGAGNLVSQAMITTAAARAQVQTISAEVVAWGPAGTAAELADDIAALPEVDAVSRFVASGGWIEQPHDPSHPDRPRPLRGLDGAGVPYVLANELVAGDFTDLTGRTLALPTTTATELGVAIGDTVDFRFGDGAAAELRIVATYDDLPGYEHLLLPADLLAAHTTARVAETVLIAGSEGTTPAALHAAVEGAVAEQSAVAVGDRATLENALQQGLNVNALINGLMILVVLAYAMIAVINTVAVSTLGRRRELAMMRLTGATQRQVTAVLLTETALAAGTGLGVGLVVACAAILPTALVVGAHLLAPLPLAILVAVGVAVAAITLPITAVAARRGMAGRPTDAIARS